MKTCGSTGAADYSHRPNDNAHAPTILVFRLSISSVFAIQRALAHGFTLENIATFVDEHRLVTCNDVYRISLQRLEELRLSGNAKAAALKKLIATCRGKGGRKDCKILAVLSEDADRLPGCQTLAKPSRGDLADPPVRSRTPKLRR